MRPPLTRGPRFVRFRRGERAVCGRLSGPHDPHGPDRGLSKLLTATPVSWSVPTRSPRPTARSGPRQPGRLLAFYDFPAEHWIHLRTTNPIASTFATVRLRTKVTKGAGSAAAALAMVFKLVESAQARWRAVNAPHLVALVRGGARFERGHLVERPETHAA